MNPERPSAYEQLSLEAAARVDAVCDGFEKAWKAARSGATAPHVSTYLDSCEGPERSVLAGELLALDRAWRRALRPRCSARTLQGTRIRGRRQGELRHSPPLPPERCPGGPAG